MQVARQPRIIGPINRGFRSVPTPSSVADCKPGQDGSDGADGEDGLGITNISIIRGELICQFSDGTTKNLGVVAGKRGADGMDGTNGLDGTDGQNGPSGKDADIKTLRALVRLQKELALSVQAQNGGGRIRVVRE